MEDTNNLFLTATRKKLRWQFQGLLSVEDLWDLSLTALNKIAVAVHQNLQKSSISFIDEVPTETTDDTLRLEILKKIIEVKKAEKAAKETAAQVRANQQRIREILAQRAQDKLANLSDEDLQKMLEEGSVL